MTDLVARRSQLDVLEELVEITRLESAEVFSLAKTFTQVVDSPFTLTVAWQKVCTTTAATLGLRLGVPPNPSAYDIEWAAVAAVAAAPTSAIGEGVLAGEDFASGLPIGDIYCKSASGQQLIVMVA